MFFHFRWRKFENVSLGRFIQTREDDEKVVNQLREQLKSTNRELSVRKQFLGFCVTYESNRCCIASFVVVVKSTSEKAATAEMNARMHKANYDDLATSVANLNESVQCS
jgi:hypothetical protein